MTEGEPQSIFLEALPMTDTLPDTAPADPDLLTRQDPATAPLASLETHMPFVRRHVGPGAAQTEHMVAALGRASLDAVIDEAVPEVIRMGERLDAPPGAVRGRGGRRAAGPRGQEPADGADDRARLLRHVHAGRHPASGSGEPRLVHRLHARTSPRSARDGSRRCSTSRP